ncbi:MULTISPECIES: restriction endonuclease subunit S [unclassified Chryseobacterium]|uniref:restriction endonuclease subunit S n=1 Tax=unclassified Chryseobacterium TaxID=2593645 RepID=UPI00226AE6B3|nr:MULTISPECIES: restriction endonuclease subunit S [unclassified Chryseobacterium]
MEEKQTHIPEGWSEDSLGNILNYEQPYKYTVDTTEYNDKSGIPVLTAGKSFLLGYTTEVHNVYKNTPVIIFDDFTTDSKFVDFPFKVKSSAMKFLKPKNPESLDIKVIFGHIQNLKIRETGGDHKRRWISEFSKLKVPLPPFPEQTQIATILSKLGKAITHTEQLIAKYTRIKTGLMQDLLTKGIDGNGNIRNEETHEFKDSPLGRIPKEWECCKMGLYVETNLYGPRFSANNYSENGNVKTIRGTDFSKSGDILYDQAPIAKLPPAMIKNHRLFNDDIVIVTTADCGLTAVFKQPENDLVFIPSAYSVKFRFKKEVYPYYLKLFMTTTFAASQVYKFVRQGTLGNLPSSDILDFDFVLPDYKEQHRIVNTIEKQEDLIVCEKNKLLKLQSLKTGLMQDLLSGKVRVNTSLKKQQTYDTKQRQ